MRRMMLTPQRAGLLVAVVGITAIAAVTLLLDPDRGSGSFGVDTEIVLLSKREPPQDAVPVLEGFSFVTIADATVLADEQLQGKLLIVDRTMLSDLPVGFLGARLRSGQPVMVFGIPLKELYALTGYEEFQRTNDPGRPLTGGALPSEPAGEYYSWVYAVGDADGVFRTGSSQGNFSMPGVFQTNLRQLALLAKGATYIPSDGRIAPLETLNTPPAE